MDGIAGDIVTTLAGQWQTLLFLPAFISSDKVHFFTSRKTRHYTLLQALKIQPYKASQELDVSR